MIFFSKSPETKEAQVVARKFRDLKALLHQQHAASMTEMAEEAEKSTGYQEATGAEEGIDEDVGSKVGAERQKVKALIHDREKTIGSRRRSIKRRRAKAKKRGKSLGFG